MRSSSTVVLNRVLYLTCFGNSELLTVSECGALYLRHHNLAILTAPVACVARLDRCVRFKYN